MIGTQDPKRLAAFYTKVFGDPSESDKENWFGWHVGNAYLMLGKHSEVKDTAQEPARIMINVETEKVKEEFERMKEIEGATVVKEPYEMEGSWIATLADPDGNYFQLMSPWK